MHVHLSRAVTTDTDTVVKKTTKVKFVHNLSKIGGSLRCRTKQQGLLLRSDIQHLTDFQQT